MIKIGTPYTLNIDSKKVSSFFKKEWSRPIALGDFNFYKWQFINVPNQNDIDNCCIAIDENLDIIAVMGVNNRKFIDNNNSINAAELTTWIVKAEYRNKGTGPKMINFLTDKYEVLIGMGISNDALPVYIRSGFKYLKAIPRYVKVIDWDKITEYAEYDSNAKKVDKFYNKKRKEKSYRIINFSEKAFENISSSFSQTNNLFSRDYLYITWRYINHPTFKYDINIVESESNSGYGVFVATRTEISDNNLKILHIIDLFGDNKDIEAAISYILEFAKIHNIPIIDFFGTNSNINSFLIKDGWFSIMDNNFFNFPYLFQPIEVRKPSTTSLIYWSKSDETSLYDIGKLYLTKQDADFDRPILKEQE
jgi:hypothetical protein